MTTQEYLPIDEVKDDLVILKDGSVAMVIQTSAVNFDLLSQNEQLAIIGSFAALLNSLSFSIQILIRSKRLDISSYLEILKKAEGTQTNPLLQLMMTKYRNFVSSIIRENEVLDKQFYVVISISALELGIVKRTQENMQKAITLLIPRRDHIIRQLSRIGLKSNQLTTEKLITLFYDLYNESVKIDFQNSQEQKEIKESAENAAKADSGQARMTNRIQAQQPAPVAPQTPMPVQPVQTPAQIQPIQPPQPIAAAPAPQPVPSAPQQGNYAQRPARNNPFVVEELGDDFRSL